MAASVRPWPAEAVDGRFRSLDIFRGAAVALMILVNNPGSWDHLYPPLAHATWHGVTPTDLVFPFFLFAVGNALALALPALRDDPAAFWRRVGRRTALIFALGLLLNASPFVRWNAAGELVPRDWATLRLMAAGWKGLFAVERDEMAFETLRHNLVDAQGNPRISYDGWTNHDLKYASKSGGAWTIVKRTVPS